MADADSEHQIKCTKKTKDENKLGTTVWEYSSMRTAFRRSNIKQEQEIFYDILLLSRGFLFKKFLNKRQDTSKNFNVAAHVVFVVAMLQ